MAAIFVNPKRIERARLAANLSRSDLAFKIREVSAGQIKATERQVAAWETGEYRPSDGVVPAIAQSTDRDIAFFYEQDDSDDDAEAELLRDLEQLPGDLRLRVERALRRARTVA